MTKFSVKSLLTAIDAAGYRVMYSKAVQVHSFLIAHYVNGKQKTVVAEKVEAYCLKSKSISHIDILVELKTWYNMPDIDYDDCFHQLIKIIITE